MKTGEKKIVKIRKGARDVGSLYVGRHRIFGSSRHDYDYTVSNQKVTLYKAPYSVSEGVVTIL